MTRALRCQDCPAVSFSHFGRAGVVAIAALLSLSPALAQSSPQNKPARPDAPKWSPWVEFGGTYSTERSRGEAGLLAPLWQNGTGLLFTDLRGKLFDENVDEFNAALGYRHMLSNGWNLGVWGGFDARRTETGNVFHQASGGVEALSDSFDLRFNGYLPLERDKLLSSTGAVTASGAPTLQQTGNQIFLETVSTISTTTMKELALGGVDGEVGMRVPLPHGVSASAIGRSELRLYGGGFYFDNSELEKAVTGPKARLEWRIDDILPAVAASRLTFDASWRDDDVRGSVWEIGARLRIPFGGETHVARLNAQERRMTERLERDTDIVSENKTTASTSTGAVHEGVKDAMSGVALDQVVFVDGGTTGGITTASANAGANTLIVAKGGSGNIASGQTLQGNQTLLGAGTALQVVGVTSGTAASYTAAGTAPTVSSGGTGLTFGGDNIHVAGVNIATSNSVGIGVEGRLNAIIDRVNISGAATYGVLINSISSSPTNVTILDTTITGNTTNGIAAFQGTNTLTVSYLTMDGAGNAAIYFNFTTTNTLALSDSTFSGTYINWGILRTDFATHNTLSGSGNTAAGATFTTGTFCQSNGSNTGSIGFDIGTCP